MTISLENITKRYAGVAALDSVSIRLETGRVHALVGENGAGKSTLIKILGGDVLPDKGSVAIDGATTDVYSKRRADQAGVRVVYQELEVLPHVSVAENIYLNRLITTPRRTVDWKAVHARSRAILRELGAESIRTDRLLSELGAAQQQLVAIARALAADASYLVLDEPTASLSLEDVDHLFGVLQRLVSSGVGVLYVSHRLEEIFRIADLVTVLKDGALVGTYDLGELTSDRLVELMVGRSVVLERSPTSTTRLEEERPVLAISDLASPPGVDCATLSVKKGEIVCLAGLVGSGRSELCEAVFGLRPVAGGRITLNGETIRPRDPRDAAQLGISMVSEDRKRTGLFPDMSIRMNIVSANLRQVSKGNHLVLSDSLVDAVVNNIVDRLRVIRRNIAQPVRSLSGGNQQKVVLARALVSQPSVLIVDEPTAGVDVGARAEIYAHLRALAAQGMAILVVSSDLLEVLALADRIVVMREGQTVAEIDGASASEEQVMRAAALSVA